jgi:peptidoglycan-associated lipoprotein
MVLHADIPAIAQEAMRLGIPATPDGEFRSRVGDRVFFAESSAELGTRARAALQAQAEWLIRNPSLNVIVEGHADDAGSSEDNVAISRLRATAVSRQLIELGVVPTRIHVLAWGRGRVVADCVDPACAAQNRRVVTLIDPVAPAATRDTQPWAQRGDGQRRARRYF